MTQKIKTQKNDASVEDFLASVKHDTRRGDSFEILEMMREVTGEPGSMWGTSIVGFGEYSYTNTTNVENKWPVTGFSPRVQSLTLYIMDGFEEYDDLLSKLGKHKLGKACLYINKLADVNKDVLRELIQKSVKHMERI